MLLSLSYCTEHLVQRIVETEPRRRNMQEIVREGRACNLYLDLEYSIEHNPAIDGDRAVRQLLLFMLDEIRRVFHVECDIHCCIDMDSSTDTKFSRHVTLVVPGHAFLDNAHVGRSVSEV
jgi:hypothetical protein